MAEDDPTPDEAEALLSAASSAAGQLQRLALAYLREKHGRGETPTSIRFLFYEMSMRGEVSKERPVVKPGKKTARTPSQYLTEAVTKLRELGLVPWDWIVDERRRIDDWSTNARTVAQAVARTVEHGRIDPWVLPTGEPALLPVLLTEDAATSGVLSRGAAYAYRVPVAAVSGNCRGFLESVVADLVRDPRTRILYVGDADDCGNAIELHTRRTLARATSRTFGPDTWERLAITPEQIERLRRQGMQPIQKRDDRYSDGNPHLAWEAEALGQAEIERLVSARLDQLLPEPMARVLVREAEQRAAVRALLARLTGGGVMPMPWSAWPPAARADPPAGAPLIHGLMRTLEPTSSFAARIEPG